MNSTPKQISLADRIEAGRALVRPHSRPGGGFSVEELPLAVGFGSGVGAAPRRLRAVPGLSGPQGDIAGQPDAVPPGRVIPLPRRLAVATDPARSTSTAAGLPASSPSASSRLDAVPVQLTRRGRLLLLAVAAAVGIAVIVSAWFGAAGATPPASAAQPAQVVVHDGDTLWSVAERILPNRDPRAVVDRLLRINHLHSPALVPGQVLRTR